MRPYLYGNLDLIEFVQEVFGAVELERFELGPRSFHVEAAIGDSVVVLEVGDPPPKSAAPASIYVYVPDVDAAYGRALEAGAEEVAPPEDKPYDERAAGVRDSFGNTWWIATYQAPEWDRSRFCRLSTLSTQRQTTQGDRLSHLRPRLRASRARGSATSDRGGPAPV